MFFLRVRVPKITTSLPNELSFAYILTVIFIFSWLTTIGCKTEHQNPLTKPETFAKIYTEILIAAPWDSLAAAYADSILASHGYGQDQFDAAMAYYLSHAELWQDVLTEVVGRLEKASENIDAALQTE